MNFLRPHLSPWERALLNLLRLAPHRPCHHHTTEVREEHPTFEGDWRDEDDDDDDDDDEPNPRIDWLLISALFSWE